MSIKRTIITALVALALVAVVAPAVNAQTPTIAQLQAMIAQLTAQLAQVSGTTTAPAAGTGACAGVTFTRNLTVGSVGADVKCFQVLLNGHGYQVSATGAGSLGMETTYFGPRTLSAVKKWQAAMGWVPANQIGPKSRAQLNAWLGSTVVTLPGTTTSTGPVSAMVATDNPASGALICGEATADLLNVNLVGTGTVTSVTLQRTGISDQNTLQNVYLFDGNTRLTDGYSFNVNGTLTMNGLNIAVNGSHEISVRADVESSIISTSCTATSSSIAIALTGINGGAVTVQGNTQSIVTGSAASAYLGADSACQSTNNVCAVQNVSAGTAQYTMWSSPLQVNTRAVSVKGANFRMIGSAPTTAISNVHLFVDGVDTGKVATLTSTNGSSYETFDFTAAPLPLATGSHQIDVRADITGGSDRTVQLSVQQASDITVYDPQIGVNISVTGPSGAIFSANQGANISIQNGSATVNIDPTFNTQTNITGGSTNATIAKYVIHGYGEDVKVSSLTVAPTISSACTGAGATTFGGTNCANSTLNDVNRNNWVSGNGLQNVTLFFNGSQVGSQQNWTAGTTLPAFNLGSQMILPAGQDSTIEVRADLQTNGNVAYTLGTISAVISVTSNNAQGQSSQTTLTVPATTPGFHSLSITTGGLQVAPNPSFSASSVGPNATQAEIGSFTVQNQSSSESIRLTQLTVGLTTNGTSPLTSGSGATVPALTDLSSLTVKAENGAVLGGSTTTPIGQVSASNVISASYTLQPGAQVILDVFANVGSSASSVMKTTLTAASIGVTSNISNPGTLQTGPQITFSSGTLVAPVKSSGTTDPAYIAAGGTGTSAYSEAEYAFVSTGSPSTINELQFTITGGPIQKICLDSACTQAFYPTGSTVDMKGLNISIPQIQSYKPFYVYYPTVGINGGIMSGTTATVNLTYIQYTSGGNTVILTNGGTATCASGNNPRLCLGANGVASNQMTLVGSVPAVTVAPSAGSSLAIDNSSDNVLGSFIVSAGAQGGVAVNTMVFNVGLSGYDGTQAKQIGASSTSAYLTKHGSTTHIGTCTGGGSSGATATITCLLGGAGTAETLNGTSFFSSDSQISQSGSIQYDLHDVVTASPSTGGSAVRASTTLSQAGFVWDDASWNGLTGSTGFTGSLISGFPIGSYSISQ